MKPKCLLKTDGWYGFNLHHLLISTLPSKADDNTEPTANHEDIWILNIPTVTEGWSVKGFGIIVPLGCFRL